MKQTLQEMEEAVKKQKKKKAKATYEKFGKHLDEWKKKKKK